MYVCVCLGITDKDIEKAVSAGAKDLRSIVKSLGLGQQCGKCIPLAQSIISAIPTPIQLVEKEGKSA